jgi:hypothetical protein
MTLDFHRLDNKQYLFRLDNQTVNTLVGIFETYTHWTGQMIDPYEDRKLSTEKQQSLLTIIDRYIEATDLNKNKAQVAAILEFKGLLKYLLNSQIDLFLIGDKFFQYVDTSKKRIHFKRYRVL